MMNNNLLIIVLSISMAFVFCFAIFTNLNVKNSKTEVSRIEQEIDDLKTAIKRQKIEVASLTNPQIVLEYIKRNDLEPVKLKNITTIYIDK